MTMCNGENCKVKETCCRFTSKPEEHKEILVNPIDENGVCDLYHSVNQQNILDQLKEIMK
ncbi:hypothetical protein Phi19:1_gp009 [Cellulophaga phage phi19:1]|uniref:Uncharacterized protein n=1 Tax=Cellulophaga phage phi19:1 TaxID=1327970 RepID=R9ZVS6_9CAUD|nr:hypothetical protein Phi19:1_gp009 [Cellulophaga phage phi19:1]AGO47299.1 hypothetical protein Phi19:1_gp009 [Cellulophaga phage phi19:1]